MGLDIYARWGEKVDGDFDWYRSDSPCSDRYEDQMTGFTSAPYAGYLRESWPSLGWVRKAAQKYDAPYPYNFFSDWEGFNNEELVLSNGNLEKVLAFRDDVLRPWLRDRERKHGIWAQIKCEVFGTSDPNEIRKVATPEKDKEYKELLKESDIFRQRIADVIGFINFVELHKDEPNLTIVFG